MKQSCAYKPCVKNKEGKMETSRLFDSLLAFFNKDRGEAKKHYFIATHPDFLSTFREDLVLDDYNEVTLDSYLKAIKYDNGEEAFLSFLNKQYKSGDYDVTEALARAQSFTTSEFSKNYIPSLVWTKEGKVHIEYVQKNQTSETALRNFYKRYNLQQRIINTLKNLGVNVTFLENNEGYLGRYSTENAEKTHDGLYNLIRVLNGEDVLESLAEEAGHFVYAALEGDVLIDRLNNALTEDVMILLMSEGIDTLRSDSDAKTELAGRLLGKALLKKQDGALASLLNRIVLKAKKVFASLSGDKVKSLLYEAEIVADKAMDNFLSSKFKGSVENAVSVKETLYSKEYNSEVSLYAQVKNELELYRKRMSAINYGLKKLHSQKVDKTLSTSTSRILTTSAPIHRSFFAVSGVVDSIQMLINDYQSVMDRLNSIDLQKDEINNDYIDIIKEARVFLTTATQILALVKEKLNKKDGIVVDDTVKESLISAVNTLDKLLLSSNYSVGGKNVSALKERVEALEKDAYMIYLEKTYGGTYITRAKKVILDGKFRLRKVTGEKNASTWNEDLEEYLSSTQESLFTEDSPVAFFFTSFQNIKDPTMSIYNDMVRQAKRYANQEVLDFKTGLLNLFDRLKELQSKRFNLKNPVDAAVFYEKDEDGEFTGNIIQPVLWGKWERALAEEKEKAKLDFELKFKDHPEKINTRYKKAQEWHRFWTPRFKAWHAVNSIEEKDETTGRTIRRPATGQVDVDAKGNTIFKANYKNDAWYNELSAEERAWVTEWVNVKTQIDAKLGREGHTEPHRLPQFRGECIERIKTTVEKNESIRGSLKPLGEVLSETFSLTSEDEDYGSDLHYRTDEDNFLDDSTGGMYGETLNRLPLYGINKLESKYFIIKYHDGFKEARKFSSIAAAKYYMYRHNINAEDCTIEAQYESAERKLSRDLFHSTLLYAEMACRYSALKDVANAASMAKEVYKKRDEAWSKNEIPNSNKFTRNMPSWLTSYGRFEKFIDVNVFSRKNQSTIGKISLRKLVQSLSSLGSTLMLAGNITVGIKDMMGKLQGILREAHVNEFISDKATKKAIKWYFKHCWAHMWNYANENAEDEISLFKLAFNVGDIYDKEAKSFSPQKSRARKFLESVLWSPLSISSSVEVIVHAALAFDTEVQDVNGNKMSLMDLYKAEATRPDGSRKQWAQRREALTDTSQQALDKHLLLSGIQGKLQYYLGMSEDDRNSFDIEGLFTQEEKDILDSEFSNNRNNYIKLLDSVTTKKESSEVSILAENKLIEAKARVILNRVAGIYNMQDRTAFQNTLLGAAFTTMRGWFNGIVAEGELNSNRFSPALNKETEGVFVTNFKFAYDLIMPRFFNDEATDIKTLIKALGSTLPLLHRISRFFNREDAITALKNAGYSEHQYNNLLRNTDNWVTIGILQALAMLFKMLSVKGLGDPEDEEDDTWMFRFFGILHYITMAVRNEMLGMYNPFLAFKQAMNFTSINGFTPVAGLIKLGKLAGLGFLEVAELIDNINPDVEYEEVFDIEKDEEPKAYLSTKHTWDFLLVKDENGEIKYRAITQPKTDVEGNIVRSPKTGKIIYEAVRDDQGRRIYKPIYKSEYQKAIDYMDVKAGDSKLKENLERTTPFLRHRDIIHNPLLAAENLAVIYK